MTVYGWAQIALYFALLCALVKPLGRYMARVYEGETVRLNRVVRPFERLVYRLAGVRPDQEMDWRAYAVSVLLFNAAGLVLLYVLQRLQGVLPLNPQAVGPVAPDLAFHTASSFVTNTNWQNYAGESTLSNLTQMAGLTVQNFVSAATGMAVLVALIRGLARHSARTIGNFWVDLTRTTLYILLPLSLLLALFLVSQGTVQSLRGAQVVSPVEPVAGVEGTAITQQVLALGPVASQVAIKHLGTNGGGFFNANAAHPFESPTPLTGFVLVLSESAIAAGLTYTFGKMVGDTRQGWAVFAAMALFLFMGVAGTYAAESAGNPRLQSLGVDQTGGAAAQGGSMEGKEVRFGVAGSSLFAAVTTATSTGAVNAMHDSLAPLAGMAALVLMQLGEVALGGVGSGLYGMLAFVIVAVFVAGLMVGRTPEYLGKKIEVFEIKMAALLILIMPVLVLSLTAVAVLSQAGRAGAYNAGPHGFSEILYAFTSQGNNNGSAFAGLNGNSLFYNLAGAAAMLIARFWLVVPTLALAGALGAKKTIPAGAGTLSTHTPLFVGWLVAVVLVVGALSFLPALALGPIVEQLTLGG